MAVIYQFDEGVQACVDLLTATKEDFEEALQHLESPEIGHFRQQQIKDLKSQIRLLQGQIGHCLALKKGGKRG